MGNQAFYTFFVFVCVCVMAWAELRYFRFVLHSEIRGLSDFDGILLFGHDQAFF